MLQTFVFPGLVVLSLVGIIVFLTKKSSAVANLSDKVNSVNQDGSTMADSKRKGRKVLTGFLIFFKKIFIGLILLIVNSGKSFWGKIKNRKIKKEKQKEEENKKIEDKVRKFNFKVERDEGNAFKRRRKIRQNESFKNNKKETINNFAGQPAQKKDLFEKILVERIAANPKDVEAYERLGEYYFEIENWNYAKECFRQVVKLNPGNSGVKIKIRKLEKLLGE